MKFKLLEGQQHPQYEFVKVYPEIDIKKDRFEIISKAKKLIEDEYIVSFDPFDINTDHVTGSFMAKGVLKRKKEKIFTLRFKQIEVKGKENDCSLVINFGAYGGWVIYTSTHLREVLNDAGAPKKEEGGIK